MSTIVDNEKIVTRLFLFEWETLLNPECTIVPWLDLNGVFLAHSFQWLILVAWIVSVEYLLVPSRLMNLRTVVVPVLDALSLTSSIGISYSTGTFSFSFSKAEAQC